MITDPDQRLKNNITLSAEEHGPTSNSFYEVNDAQRLSSSNEEGLANSNLSPKNCILP